MAVMRIDYQGIVEALRDEISNGGANLNQNLRKNVEQILYGDPTKRVIEVNRYPAVIVHLISKTEDWVTLGNIGAGDSGIRNATITFQVVALVDIARNNSDDGDKEVRYLASNIEGLIRNDIRLGNTTNLMWIAPTETNFADIYREGTHLSSATITFQAAIQITQ